MRLREIKPDEVICCKTLEEMQTLIDYFKIDMVAKHIWDYKIYIEDDNDRRNCLRFDEHGKYYGFCSREYYEEKGKTITEFSDLIIPELSAEEALQILKDICDSSVCGALCPLNEEENGCLMQRTTFIPNKVLKVCEQWKADHEKKQPELEWVNVCRVIQIQDNGVKKCVYEEDLASGSTDAEIKILVEAILKEYISENDGNYIAVVERVCRIKK